MTKREQNKIEKLIVKIDIRMGELERTMTLGQLNISHSAWTEYVRIGDYKKELKQLITK
jgi:hypothetical protein